jgi:signal transduction histidine kinase
LADQLAVDAANAVKPQVTAAVGQSREELDKGFTIGGTRRPQAKCSAIPQDDVDDLGRGYVDHEPAVRASCVLRATFVATRTTGTARDGHGTVHKSLLGIVLPPEGTPAVSATLDGWPSEPARSGLRVFHIARSARLAIVAAADTAQARLRSLLDAGIALTSELSLDSVLRHVMEAAATLTGARYAALGVIDAHGTELERFLTYGIDDETHAAIGDLPHGRGILGVLIRERAPLRLRDLTEDRRAVGFPAHHPPMRSFLGVPIVLRGVAFGNLYLTEKQEGAEFTSEDQELVELLASQAAVAIENARLYEAATSWSRQLESLHDVVRSLVEESELDAMLELICRRLRELIDARIAFIALPEGPSLLRIASADGDAASELIGQTLDRERSKSGHVLKRVTSARVDSMLDDHESDQDVARRMGVHTGLYVPLVARGRAIGIVVMHDKLSPDRRFSDTDLRLAEIFAARAAVAVDLSERVARETVRRVVEAQELERSRLARELHDETGQALTSILLGLRSIRAAESEADADRAEANLRELIVQALQDVRRLAVELRPSALDDFGLTAAVERLAATFQERTGIHTAVEADLPPARLSQEIETVLYRVIQEALTNVVKHAGAERVSIVLTQRSNGIRVVVEDDGRGFDADDIRHDALGVVGMRERVALVGGSLEIESTAGTGTTLAAYVPLGLSTNRANS